MQVFKVVSLISLSMLGMKQIHSKPNIHNDPRVAHQVQQNKGIESNYFLLPTKVFNPFKDHPIFSEMYDRQEIVLLEKRAKVNLLSEINQVLSKSKTLDLQKTIIIDYDPFANNIMASEIDDRSIIEIQEQIERNMIRKYVYSIEKFPVLTEELSEYWMYWEKYEREGIEKVAQKFEDMMYACLYNLIDAENILHDTGLQDPCPNFVMCNEKFLRQEIECEEAREKPSIKRGYLGELRIVRAVDQFSVHVDVSSNVPNVFEGAKVFINSLEAVMRNIVRLEEIMANYWINEERKLSIEHLAAMSDQIIVVFEPAVLSWNEYFKNLPPFAVLPWQHYLHSMNGIDGLVYANFDLSNTHYYDYEYGWTPKFKVTIKDKLRDMHWRDEKRRLLEQRAKDNSNCLHHYNYNHYSSPNRSDNSEGIWQPRSILLQDRGRFLEKLEAAQRAQLERMSEIRYQYNDISKVVQLQYHIRYFMPIERKEIMIEECNAWTKLIGNKQENEESLKESLVLRGNVSYEQQEFLETFKIQKDNELWELGRISALQQHRHPLSKFILLLNRLGHFVHVHHLPIEIVRNILLFYVENDLNNIAKWSLFSVASELQREYEYANESKIIVPLVADKISYIKRLLRDESIVDAHKKSKQAECLDGSSGKLSKKYTLLSKAGVRI